MRKLGMCVCVFCIVLVGIAGFIAYAIYAAINSVGDKIIDDITHKPPKIEDIDVLLQTTNGTILGLDSRKKYYNPLVMERIENLTTFDNYLNETIYYATTKSDSPIFSTSENYANLTQAEDLNTTAMAVDYITGNIYVLDSVAKQVYVIDSNDEFRNVVANNSCLHKPKDIFLVPEEGLIFILDESMVCQASMDGTNFTKILNYGITPAMTIDKHNKAVYISAGYSIEFYYYHEENAIFPARVISNDVIDTVAFVKYKLFYAHSSSRNILHVCTLKKDSCYEGCCEWQYFETSDRFEKIQAYDTKPSKTVNPCDYVKGECDHLCVLSRDDEELTFKCLCNEGWTLGEDGRTCTMM